jgi:DNA-binding beta-propeller fold protein YncE
MRRFLLPLFAVLIVAASCYRSLFQVQTRSTNTIQLQASVFPLQETVLRFPRRCQRKGIGLSDPFGIAVSNDGVVYFSDGGEGNRIRKLTVDGKLSSLAGGNEGFADGSQASFNTPSGLAIDADGNLLVADTGNNRIRKVTPQGVVNNCSRKRNGGIR